MKKILCDEYSMQYKLYIESSFQVTNRRTQTNKFYISLLTIMLGTIPLGIKFIEYEYYRNFIFLSLSILGILLESVGKLSVFEPKNLALYTYCHQNPLILVDPDGRAPNQAGATNPSVILAELRGYESQGMTGAEALAALSANHGDNQNRYFYTGEYGWVDVRHFGAAAQLSTDIGDFATEALGLGNEIGQWLSESGDDYRSGFSPEDIPSNAAGARFGANLNENESIADQFENWLGNAGGRDTNDPRAGFNNLPATDPSERGGVNRGSSNASHSKGPGAAIVGNGNGPQPVPSNTLDNGR